MFKLRDRPYNLLLLTAVLFFAARLFGFSYLIDIHFHDTYVILPSSFLVWPLVVALVFLWLVYLLTKRFLFSNLLTWTHVALTITSSFFIFYFSFYSAYPYQGLAGMPRRYYDFSSFSTFKLLSNIEGAVAVAFMTFVVTQLAYLINLLLGIYRKAVKKEEDEV